MATEDQPTYLCTYQPTTYLCTYQPTYQPTCLPTFLINRELHTRARRGAAGGETRRKAGNHWGRWDKRAEEGMNEKTKQGGSGGRDQGRDQGMILMTLCFASTANISH